MRPTNTLLLASLLLGTATAVTPQAAFAAEAQPAAAPRAAPPSINVVAAKREELRETVTVTGTIVARDTAALGTDVSGLQVVELNVDEGDTVKKGDVLAVLDRRSLDTQLKELEANRAQAEAAAAQVGAQITDAEVAVRQSGEALRRAQELKNKGVSAQSQLDDAINAADSAKARLIVAQRALSASQAQLSVIDAQRGNLQLQIDKTQVRAPADGLVLKRDATLGGVVSANAGPLFRIAINSEFELAADVSEAALARLTKGLPVEVRLAGLDQPIKGKIRRVSPEVNQQSRLGSIRVTLEEHERARVGNFARGEIEINRRETVAVPVSAVIYQGRDAFLQVVSDGKVRTTPVKLGIRGTNMIEVVSGVGEGTEVVARAGTFVADGDAITPVREAEAQAGATVQ
ncbi:MAG: efflux RND transporter periplasmic adaptor subunit [Methylobacterium mesophilicum]|nr:efflux RND transporter periplasmic adaptor subunit [Methylobacterium mesophilicum]